LVGSAGPVEKLDQLIGCQSLMCYGNLFLPVMMIPQQHQQEHEEHQQEHDEQHKNTNNRTRTQATTQEQKQQKN
jgi:hypothetical protein